MAFARVQAEEYRGRFLDLDQGQRLGVRDNRTAAILLASLEEQVSRYVGSPPSFLPIYLRRLLEKEINRARRLFAAHSGGVLVLTQAGNGFGLDVIVDVFNERARRALSNWGRRAPDYRDDEPAEPPPAPPLTSEWSDNVERGPAPVRLASEQEATASFLTLFSDALRISATSSSSVTPLQVYTVNCNLKGWILESWPQFNYSPTRFGNTVTWPVTDTILTSGNYMFQGLKGASVRQDSTPHYLGPSRTKTLVKL